STMVGNFNPQGLDGLLLQFRVKLISLIALLISCAAIAVAQGPARPDRGIRQIGSYSVSDIEAINLTNGNLSLSIPLASLPPIAAGKLSWVLQGVYNSKLWDAISGENQTHTTPPVTYTTSTPQLSEFGGWRIGKGYDLVFRESRLDFGWILPVTG